MFDLVLVGGGHSHVAVLKHFGMSPMRGVRLTLISRGFDTPYSGMLPGLIAGHYTYDDAHIDLQRLARFAGARAFFDEAVGLDLRERLVRCANRPPVRYDVLSIDIGSTPNASAPGAAEHAIAVKPIDRFLERWEALCERIVRSSKATRLAVVGGGAGGVELLLSAQHRLRALLDSAGRSDTDLECHLFTSSAAILPTHNARARRLFARVFEDRRVQVHTASEIVEVGSGWLRTAGGERYEVDEILWTTEARAAEWLRASGLATDESGFVSVGPTLQSVSHPDVFAAGDVASMVNVRLEKSGVYAVRQGQALGPNLRRALARQPLEPYRPQRRFLSLISTGDRYAVASRGAIAFPGRWVWTWKDSIDRRFMRQYNELPAMETHAGTDDGMRCGGCGAKIASAVLRRVLARLEPGSREDVLVGLDAADDAAVVVVPQCHALVQTVDFFRAIVDDPYLFGRIAATHALGDVYAMGAEPHSALAIATVPYESEERIEDTLTQMLSGAISVLRDAGAVLIGGHTSEGAEVGLGFAVNGVAERTRLLRKSGLQPGDRLVLTKPLGTGTLFAADMRHRARGSWIAQALASMTQSSREAAARLIGHGATACTDVTGFGLYGHAQEMARASRVHAEISLGAVPLLPGAEETARAGLLSTMHPKNRALDAAVATGGLTATPRYLLLFDPQTAGGLLAGVPAERAGQCVADLRAAGYPAAAIVGTVLSDDPQGRVTCAA